MTFRLNNKWPGRLQVLNFDSLPTHYQSAQGILPITMAIDPSVGTETVLVIFERTEFVHELAGTRPFNLMLKTGLVNTSYGPLMFFLFWVPHPHLNQPLMVLECHMNPLNPVHVSPWRDLARQSHWHLFILDGNNEQQEFFEFENIYDLDETLDAVGTACESLESIDFDAAKAEFCEAYDINDLYQD